MNKEHAGSSIDRPAGAKQGLNFAMEYRLKALSPDLHRRFTDAVFAIQYNLSNYQLIFPEFTDHTNLHSLSVIDFCNRLIGDQIDRLNANELYVLLMSCYFHDTGMGISRQDYEAFSRQIDFGDYFETHARDNFPRIIRDFHHEFSGCFIRKYAPLFEIPSEAHLWAIIQVSRGHRKTDLMDEKEYPPLLEMPDGKPVCLPYLAAMIRLADEIDVAAARNPILLYDIEALTIEHEIIENKKVRAVRRLDISEKVFTVVVEPDEPFILAGVREIVGKMQRTLDICQQAVRARTPYTITQERVDMIVAEDG